QLDHAENGQIAIEHFKRKHYDVVLMDIQMPVVDGYTAVETIRAWEREKRQEPTPIIALTASALDEAVQRSLAAGCTAHIAKPVRKATLLEAIKSSVRGGATISATR
ncbi:MAG: response regulator, partial [Candidatus Binataceae bacterium]